MEWLTLLLGTVLLRPYVFVFLAIYLTIAITQYGRGSLHRFYRIGLHNRFYIGILLDSQRFSLRVL